ncbi:MAG TPA: methylmalonyl-CoA epimerase [Gaiellales bacterium]|jgi:methylmalonyl-CoA epimerase|nr:methylmalonyl-CoA epimerase [Gaiellales bacterium]
MHPREVHHIGHAVEDMTAAVTVYERLFGAAVEHRETVPEQGVEAVSLRVGTGRIELLRPLAEDTPVGRFIAGRGPGMHHVAFRVDDIRASLREVADAGAELIDEEPHPGLFGLQVAFIHPASVAGVLVEYVEVEGVADG